MTPATRRVLARSILALATLVPAAACTAPMEGAGPATGASQPPGPATTEAPTTTSSTVPPTTTTTTPPTTVSPWGGSEGKLAVPGGGDIIVNFARRETANKDVPPLQPGQFYVSVDIYACAKGQPLPIEPALWQVEIPGQGLVTSQPLKLRNNVVTPGQVVQDKACTRAFVPFLVGGAGNVTAVYYSTPAGPLRWATSTL